MLNRLNQNFIQYFTSTEQENTTKEDKTISVFIDKTIVLFHDCHITLYESNNKLILFIAFYRHDFFFFHIFFQQDAQIVLKIKMDASSLCLLRLN